MGNIFTRAAQLPKAVLLFVLLTLTSVLALSVGNHTASADGIVGASPYSGKAIFIVRLTGSANPSQYAVTAVRQSTNESLGLTYIAGGVLPGDPAEFFVKNGFVWGGDSSQCINSSTTPGNTALTFSWKFTVTVGGKSAGSKSVNYCGQPDGTSKSVLVSIPVTDGKTTGSGTASGTLAYTAPDGTAQPFRSNTVATLTGSGGSTSVKISDTGAFTISAVPAGTYTLKATYNPTIFDHGELQNGPPYILSTSVTIADGKNTDASFTLGADGKVTAGTTLGSAACADGQSQDGTGACTDDGEDTINCGTGGMNWVVCPVIQAAVKGAQQLDNFIMDTLDFDVKGTFDDTDKAGSSANGYYTAWNSFRILGTAFLVIAGLVMVASQALGFEFLDAYTIRKTLPRLLVAIIGISLSWPLMRFVVGFFDIAGFDVRELIYKPFENFGGVVSVSGGILSTLAAGAAIYIMGFASLTLIVTILMAVFVGFLILLLRQIVLIMLIILAPVAIACYILPNTQKAWHLWRDNFLGLLLMFPIMSGLIAAAHVFSAVALKNASAASLAAHASGPVTQLTGHGFTQMTQTVASFVGSWTSQAIALGAWFYVYFLLPKSAEVATGAVSTAIGGVHKRAAGVRGWASKKRGGAFKDKLGRAQGNQLTGGTNRFTRGINSAASMATDPGSNIPYYLRKKPGFRRAGAEAEGQLEHMRMEQSQKLFNKLNPTFNDKAYRAINGGLHSETDFTPETLAEFKKEGLLNKTPQSIADFHKMSEILGASTSQAERLAGTAIEGSAGMLASLYRDPEMGKASIAAAGMLGLATHGFLNGNDINPGSNAVAADGGPAFAQAITNQSQIAVARSMPHLKAGYGADRDKATGQIVNGLNANGGVRSFELLETLNSSDIAGAKAGFFKPNDQGGFGTTLNDVLTYGEDRGGTIKARLDAQKEYRDKASVQLTDLKDNNRTEEYEAVAKDLKAYEEKLKARKLDAAGQVELKQEMGYRQYASVKKALQQVAGPYSHAGISGQTLVTEMLEKHHINPDATRTTDPGAVSTAMGGGSPVTPPPDPAGGGTPTP